MKIRPLKKINAGKYISNDKEWCLEKFAGSWNCYKDDHTNYYFFYSFPTLRSLIKMIESL